MRSSSRRRGHGRQAPAAPIIATSNPGSDGPAAPRWLKIFGPEGALRRAGGGGRKIAGLALGIFERELVGHLCAEFRLRREGRPKLASLGARGTIAIAEGRRPVHGGCRAIIRRACCSLSAGSTAITTATIMPILTMDMGTCSNPVRFSSSPLIAGRSQQTALSKRKTIAQFAANFMDLPRPDLQREPRAPQWSVNQS